MEFDIKTLLVTLGFYAIAMFGMWGIKMGTGFPLKHKIFLSIAALPCFYVMAYWQLNK